jgi:hypothetical protein
LYLVPWITFFVTAVISTWAQRAFLIAALREASPSVRSDDDILGDIVERPSGLFGIIARETPPRLRALVTPHPTPVVERRRRIAVVWIALSLASFVWVAVSKV